MKLSLRKIIEAYDALKNARISTLETAEQSKIFKINRAIYAHYARYDAERQDIMERLKPQEFDEMAEIESKIQAGCAERDESLRYIAVMTPYRRAINQHLKPLLDEEHDLNVEPIDEAIWQKVLKENKWTFEQYNAVEDFIKKE
jgi:hypothetical protein